MNLRLTLCSMACTFLLLMFSCTPSPDSPKPSCDSELGLTVASVKESPCGIAQGSFTLRTTGGDGQYEYQLNAGAFVSSSTFKGLEPDNYHVLVRDGLGCVAETEVVIPSGLLLADVRPILEANCAVSGCHVGSNSARVNFKDASNILANADDIKDRVRAGSMPPQNSGYALTTEEIDLLSCWVNDGARD